MRRTITLKNQTMRCIRNILVACFSVAFLFVLSVWFAFKTFKAGAAFQPQGGIQRITLKAATDSSSPLDDSEMLSKTNAPVIDARDAHQHNFKSIPPASGQTAVITAVDNDDNDWEGYFDAGLRSRAVRLNGGVLNASVFPKDTELSLALFDDVTVDAVVSESFRNVNGTISTTATIKGSEYGRVFIASTGGELHARIRDVDRHKLYAIQYNHAADTHYSLELDFALGEPENPIGNLHPAVPEFLSSESVSVFGEESASPPLVISDEGTVATAVVDIMVVYTDDAMAAAGSQAAMDNNIALGVSMANDAHANTVTHIVWYLVHSYEVTYSETGNNTTDVNWVTTDSTVRTNRNNVGADFVIMMNNTGSGGVAWQLTDPRGKPENAFSVVDDNSFASYSPSHEVGHNMGASHARDQDSQWGPTEWISDTNSWGASTAGWHWHPTPTNKPGYCCVMTYTQGSYFDGVPPTGQPSPPAWACTDGLGHTKVGLFSDPDITHEGLAAGDSMYGNNAQVLRQLRHVYAAYRSRLTGTRILVDYPNGGETITEGSTYSLLWDSSGVAGNVKIELLQNGSLDSVINAGTLNDRTYAWTVPVGKGGMGYTIRISDVATGAVIDTSDAPFSIDTPFYVEMLDTNPGYARTGSFEFGVPSGKNKATAAYTGVNVYDTDLDDTCFEEGTLTSIAIDCSDYINVKLGFMAHAYFTTNYTFLLEASNDNLNWTNVYSLVGSLNGSWKRYGFDIASIADGESTIYIRWKYFWSVSRSQNSGGGLAIDDIALMGNSILSDFEQWLVDNGYEPDTGEDTLAANGINTLREVYVAGLDPTDLASRFDISRAGLQLGNRVLGWNSVSGRLYSVYWSSNLLNGFQILQSNIPWTVESFTDSVHSAENPGFYQIGVQRAEP